jgi:hypothetical protein
MRRVTCKHQLSSAQLINSLDCMQEITGTDSVECSKPEGGVGPIAIREGRFRIAIEFTLSVIDDKFCRDPPIKSAHGSLPFCSASECKKLLLVPATSAHAAVHRPFAKSGSCFGLSDVSCRRSQGQPTRDTLRGETRDREREGAANLPCEWPHVHSNHQGMSPPFSSLSCSL